MEFSDAKAGEKQEVSNIIFIDKQKLRYPAFARTVATVSAKKDAAIFSFAIGAVSALVRNQKMDFIKIKLFMHMVTLPAQMNLKQRT